MTHAQRRAGSKIHLHALFWASIILLSTSAYDVALAKSKILADTKFGLVTWGKDLLIVAPGGDTVEIHGGDGVMLPFNAEPSDYWKLAEGTLVAQVEGQNEVALLFQRTAGPCVPRYRLLLLKLSEPARAPGTSQTYREPMGGLSRPFGTCMEGQVKLELPREDLVTVTMPSKAQGGNALFEFDIESDMNSVRLLGGLNEKFIPDQISPPCLSGICLGDEIAKHATSIDWKLPKIEVTKGNSPFSELYLLQERALGIPAGSGKNIYLTGENADGVTIDFYQKHPSFANFNVACCRFHRHRV